MRTTVSVEVFSSLKNDFCCGVCMAFQFYSCKHLDIIDTFHTVTLVESSALLAICMQKQSKTRFF